MFQNKKVIVLLSVFLIVLLFVLVLVSKQENYNNCLGVNENQWYSFYRCKQGGGTDYLSQFYGAPNTKGGYGRQILTECGCPPPPPPPPPPRPPRRSCFTQKTLISMADGSEKTIDKVKSGDYVISGKTLEPVMVLMTEKTDPIENSILVGINGSEPFITSSHCLLTTNNKKICLDPELSIKQKHWDKDDVVKMDVGKTLYKLDNENIKEFLIEKIEEKNSSYLELYNITTSDHSFIANKICVGDDFPEIEKYPDVSLRILYILNNTDGQKDLRQLCEESLEYKPDISEFYSKLELFFEMMNDNPELIKLADEIWCDYFDILNTSNNVKQNINKEETQIKIF